MAALDPDSHELRQGSILEQLFYCHVLRLQCMFTIMFAIAIYGRSVSEPDAS